MANPTSRVRGAGSPARRTMTAAARAAAKRAGRPAGPAHEEHGDLLADGSADASSARAEERRPGPTPDIEAPAAGRDDSPEPSPEPAEEGSAQGAPARLPRWRLPAVVLGVVLAAGLVAVAVLGWRYREGQQVEEARGQALAAAQRAAPAVLSYDYRHLDRDFARARTYLTGAFRDQYLKTTRTVVGPTATKYHGVVTATVAAPTGGGSPAASVVSAAPDKVTVLLFVNQVTRSTQVPGPRVDLNRVRMTLTRTSAGWKVSAVDAL